MQSYKKLLTKEFLYLTGTGWGILGFKRGLNKYDYQYKHDYENPEWYTGIKKDNTKPYLYTDKIFYGLSGLIIYMNPGTFPITIYKEIYRLEINIRGMEEEKNTKYYNIL